jgi:hypothetical protein
VHAATDLLARTRRALTEAGLSGTRLASGQGLAALFTSVRPPRGRLGPGWRMLTFAASPVQLDGQPWWRAWKPKTSQAAAGSAAPAADRDWLAPQVQGLAATVSAGHTRTHLIPDGSPPAVESVITVVASLLENRELPPHNNAPGLHASVLIAAHPLVVGTALSFASRGHLAGAYRDGRAVDAPLLRALLPDQWRAADVTHHDRRRLLAAEVVSRRLATRKQREALLAQVTGSPWIDAGQLERVLADRDAVLGQALKLHALLTTLACHGEALAAVPAAAAAS